MATEITSWADLDSIRNDLDGDYILMNDLGPEDTGYDTYASDQADGGSGWLPIGDNTTPFTGTFDGQGHTISNLYINRGQENNAGLFGYASGSMIENVGLEDVDVSKGSGSDWWRGTGGLVGYIRFSTVSNSYSTGTVSGDNFVGGLVGLNYVSEVSNSYTTGDVNGNEQVGGLVGRNRDSTVSNSYTTGDVSGNDNVGGLVGEIRDSSVQNSYATGTVSGGSRVGGLVGRVANSTGDTDEILYSYANSDINPSLDLIGSTSIGGTLDTTGSSLKTTAEMTDWENDYPDAYSGWDFTNIWQVTSWNEDQDGNKGYPALTWEESPAKGTAVRGKSGRLVTVIA